MAPPGKAEEKGQAHEGKEFFELSGISHVGGFKIETTLFEVTKQELNTPAEFVKFERFMTVEAVADKMKSRIAAAFALNRFASKEDVKPPYSLSSLAFLPLASCGVLSS